MADMTEDVFGGTPMGKVAMVKFGKVSDTFRIYEMGWLEERPEDFNYMDAKGADFRRAKTGKNKGKLSIMIPGSIRKVIITKEEINQSNL